MGEDVERTSIEALIHDLANPCALGHPADEIVDVVQTHISVVFLVGDRVYKLKKPLDLGFLDFTSLDKRRHYCQEEVRLNRRLAPSVYLGVAPVVTHQGRLRLLRRDADDVENAIDYVVVMRRLNDDANFASLLDRHELTSDLCVAAARRLRHFHDVSARGAHISQVAGVDTVSFNIRENFLQTRDHPSDFVEAEIWHGVREASDALLSRLAPTIDRRAQTRACDTHGDLRLDHFYCDEQGTEGLCIIDCIEFNERFRFADPVADIAFLVMDLLMADRRDLALAFTKAWSRGEPDDPALADLTSFYVAYRAIVRAKVEGFRAREHEVPKADRQAAADLVTRYWDLARRVLEGGV